MGRIASCMILALLLFGSLTFALSVGFVHAQVAETVYINSDGSVSPSSAPIASSDNVTYSFMGNISYPAYFGVVVERSDIVIDGKGYTVQGNYSGEGPVPRLGSYDSSVGLSLMNTSNVTVENANMMDFHFGMVLRDSNNNVIRGNDVTMNNYGIFLNSSPSNIVDGNDAAGNRNDGIYLDSSSNNSVTGNNASATFTNRGIYLYSSSNNTVSWNDASVNGVGIDLDHSLGNIVRENNATENADGILLGPYSSNNTVSGNDATGDIIGIWVNSNNNTVSGNNATANYYGIELDSSLDNTIIGNTLAANTYAGIRLYASSNNTMYHNDFIENVAQASVDPTSVGNAWNDDYPSGGNYWSDYNGTDLYSGPYQNVTGSDGTGDVPYVIDANDTDYYPLIGAFSDFNVAKGIDVQVVSNSTISNFQFNGTAILFNVSGVNGTTGFCNVCVLTDLLNDTFIVLVNGTKVQYSLLPSSNSKYSYLYFTYGHSTEQVTIVPEFPDSPILAMFMLATLLAIAIYKKKRNRSTYALSH
jgi:parallel beta-helix repeat protein